MGNARRQHRRVAGRRPAGRRRARETYAWPLVALVAVILPQVLVPSGMREGPPLLVPVIEGSWCWCCSRWPRRPGPVPRAARPLVLTLVAVLIGANTAAAVRLLVVILRTPPRASSPPPSRS